MSVLFYCLCFQKNKEDLGNTPKLPVKPQLVSIYLGLVKWSLQAMDVHMVNPLNNQNTNANVIRPRSKEEKEAMDHLSSIVSMLLWKNVRGRLNYSKFENQTQIVIKSNKNQTFQT